MKLPWVSRKQADAAVRLYAEAQGIIASQAQTIAASKATEQAAMERGQEMAINYANASEEISKLKLQLANQVAHSRVLETKLVDCEDPPVTRDDLKKLLHRIGFLESENEGMRKKFIPDGIWPLPDVQ